MRLDGAPEPARPNLGMQRAVTRKAALPPAVTNSSGLPLTKCEFCGEHILWVREVDNPNARTPEGKIGKLIPIDPEPVNDQRATLVMSPPAGTYPQHRVGEMRTNQAAGYRASGGRTYLRHVKTCSNADELRRGVKTRHQRRR